MAKKRVSTLTLLIAPVPGKRINKVKLEEARDAYYTHSGTASSVCRQASFAGIAIIWIFKNENAGVFTLPETLLCPTLFLLLSLLSDLLQYMYSSAASGVFHRNMEKKHGVDYTGDVFMPKQLNWPTNLFFWGKLVFLVFGYVLLINHSATSVAFIS